MTPHALVGSKVHLVAWDDLRDLLPDGPNGNITSVTVFGPNDVQVEVKVSGLSRGFMFDLDEVELLPMPPSHDAPIRRGHRGDGHGFDWVLVSGPNLQGYAARIASLCLPRQRPGEDGASVLDRPRPELVRRTRRRMLFIQSQPEVSAADPA